MTAFSGYTSQNHGEKSQKSNQLEKVSRKKAALQRYSLEHSKGKLSLILHYETRWNSLERMIDKFPQLRRPLSKASRDIQVSFSLSDEEFSLPNEPMAAL